MDFNSGRMGTARRSVDVRDLQKLAAVIPDCGTLARLLKGMKPEEREQTLKGMKPYLRFELDEERVWME